MYYISLLSITLWQYPLQVMLYVFLTSNEAAHEFMDIANWIYRAASGHSGIRTLRPSVALPVKFRIFLLGGALVRSVLLLQHAASRITKLRRLRTTTSTRHGKDIRVYLGRQEALAVAFTYVVHVLIEPTTEVTTYLIHFPHTWQTVVVVISNVKKMTPLCAIFCTINSTRYSKTQL